MVKTSLSLLIAIFMQREKVQVRIGEVDSVQVFLAAIRRHAKHGGVVAKPCVSDRTREND